MGLAGISCTSKTFPLAKGWAGLPSPWDFFIPYGKLVLLKTFLSYFSFHCLRTYIFLLIYRRHWLKVELRREWGKNIEELLLRWGYQKKNTKTCFSELYLVNNTLHVPKLDQVVIDLWWSVCESENLFLSYLGTTNKMNGICWHS